MNTLHNAGERHSYPNDCGRQRYYASAGGPPPLPKAARNRSSAHDQFKDAPIAILLSRDSQRHSCGYAESPRTSQSGKSMHSSPLHAATDAGSPNTDDVRHAHYLGRLSLDNGDEAVCEGVRGRHLVGKHSPLAPKRSASSELARPGSCQSPRVCDSAEPLIWRPTPASRLSQRGCHERPRQRRLDSRERLRSCGLPSAGMKPRMRAVVPRHGGGYEPDHASGLPPARQAARHAVKVPSALKEAPGKPASTPIPYENDTSSTPPDCCSDSNVFEQKTSGNKYDIVLQPASTPISQDQLAAEVKGIYAGLVMVEAKCINICAAQTAQPKSQLGAEQWQALIALHRTLLYEHHDFLMATQHPSASQALRGLAIKYSMPARMWKHGIHAFLEVLRHRRPESQDYMLAFIHLAYQMIALLFETVPSFTDTWVECLGDLARYRMAIEEEREAHATWGGVASRWYTLASDRHPAIGRLYHHLGILERPSLRKYCYYSKSLTCVMPFPNARDSLATLCGPIVLDHQTIESSSQSAEARIVTYHALIVVRRDLSLIDSIGKDCLRLLKQDPSKLRDFGANLAVTNIATQFELGSPNNALWQLYTAVVSEHAQSARTSLAPAMKPHDHASSAVTPSAATPHLQSTTAFTANCINFVLGQYNDPRRLKDSLPFVHVSLVWLQSLHFHAQKLASSTACRHSNDLHSCTIPLNFVRLIDFSSLAAFLNTLLSQSSDAITPLMRERARKGVFLLSEQHKQRPLPEDFTIRGLIWSQFYFTPTWFDGQSEDDGRNIETETTSKARVERILWLGLYLAFWTDRLQYDVHEKVFSAIGEPVEEDRADSHPAMFDSEPIATTESSDCRDSLLVAPGSQGSLDTSSSSSTCSPSPSPSNSEDDDWQKIKKPKTNAFSEPQQPSAKDPGAGPKPSKPKADNAVSKNKPPLKRLSHS